MLELFRNRRVLRARGDTADCGQARPQSARVPGCRPSLVDLLETFSKADCGHACLKTQRGSCACVGHIAWGCHKVLAPRRASVALVDIYNMCWRTLASVMWEIAGADTDCRPWRRSVWRWLEARQKLALHKRRVRTCAPSATGAPQPLTCSHAHAAEKQRPMVSGAGEEDACPARVPGGHRIYAPWVPHLPGQRMALVVDESASSTSSRASCWA